MLKNILIVLMLLSMCLNSAFARLKQRWVPSKPDVVETVNSQTHFRDRIVIKFSEKSGIRLRKSGLISANGSNLESFKKVINQYKIVSLERFFTVDEFQLDLDRITGRQKSGKELADLNLYYILTLHEGQEPEPVIRSLLKLSLIETAYASPKVIPAEDIEPETPDFTQSQRYLYDAPEGIDAPAAWRLEGGRGDDVKIIDIEFDWTFDHEDLKEPFASDEPDLENEWVSHGDAVLGVLVGQHNEYGLDGICPDVDIGGFSIAGGFRTIGETISRVVRYLDEGDIFLIELQLANLQPVEFERATFDVIETATSNGIICIEAAGNGSWNFDSRMYRGRFNPDIQHSGAIIVGAGNPPVGEIGPDRSRCNFSNYGRRVDLQGWGRSVVTAGYGDIFFPNDDKRQWYTGVFSGTSSASPIVTGAVACIQGIYKARTGGEAVLPPGFIRDILHQTGSPQQRGEYNGNIGPRPNLAEAIELIPYALGKLYGTVTDQATEEAIEGARVRTDYGLSAVADDRGFWQIENAISEFDFTVTASGAGYLDSIISERRLAPDDSLEFDFALFHSMFTPSREILIADVSPGESEEIVFSIDNSGNGQLTWSAERRLEIENHFYPWDIMSEFNPGEQVDDTRIEGVVFVRGRFYVSGANGGNPLIYVFDSEGAIIDSFAQAGEHARGMKDLAWDGEKIWGVEQNRIYGFSTDGDDVSILESPYESLTAITWDSERELFWVSGFTTDIAGIDPDGNVIVEIDRNDLFITGLAYHPEDPDDSQLYIINREVESLQQRVHKINPDDVDYQLIALLNPGLGGTPNGAEITNELVPLQWTFLSVSNSPPDSGGDRIEVRHLDEITNWFELVPDEGIIVSGESQELTLHFNAHGFPEGLVHGELLFHHTADSGLTILPAAMNVTTLDIDRYEEANLPSDFRITSTYPNPFNSELSVAYLIESTAEVTLTLFDMSGREAASLYRGVPEKGVNRLTWHSGGLPTGVYFLRLESARKFSTVKVLLLR